MNGEGEWGALSGCNPHPKPQTQRTQQEHVARAAVHPICGCLCVSLLLHYNPPMRSARDGGGGQLTLELASSGTLEMTSCRPRGQVYTGAGR